VLENRLPIMPFLDGMMVGQLPASAEFPLILQFVSCFNFEHCSLGEEGCCLGVPQPDVVDLLNDYNYLSSVLNCRLIGGGC
jgi:hypothetical protein